MDWMDDIWANVKAIGKVVISLGGLVFALLAILLQFGDLNAGLLALDAQLQDVTSIIAGLPLHPVMNMVNRVFPLTEYLGLVSAQLGLMVAAMLVRWIKAIILFWSGG